MAEKDAIRHKQAQYGNRVQISLETKKKKPPKLPPVKFGIMSQVYPVQRAVELLKAEKHNSLTVCL